MLTASFLSLLLSAANVVSLHPVSRDPYLPSRTKLSSGPADFETFDPSFVASAKTSQPIPARPTPGRDPRSGRPQDRPGPDRRPEGPPNPASKCRRIMVRREVRQLDPAQRSSLFQALKKLNSAPHPNTYDRFARQHNENNKVIHSAPVFLVWHRMFLRRFEQELQAIDPSVALAYWDWSKDSNAPERSSIFSNDYFGGDSQGCVKSGSFADWKVHYPDPHCLTRRWNNGSPAANNTTSDNKTPVLGKFLSSYVIDAIIDQSETFEKFRLQIENVPHSYPHTWIGGDMTTMHSPNDPIFYFHHGFIDKLFDEWQQEDSSRYVKYSGRNKDGSMATLDDPLSTLNARVREAMNVKSLCYMYEDRLRRRGDPPALPGDAAKTPSTDGPADAAKDGTGKAAGLMGMALDFVDSVLKKPEEEKKDDKKYEPPAEEPKENDQKAEIKVNKKKKKKPHKSKYLNFNKKEAKCVAARLEEEIQIPELIPECWIKLNGYDVKTVRRIEASYNCLVRKINKQYRLLKSSTAAPAGGAPTGGAPTGAPTAGGALTSSAPTSDTPSTNGAPTAGNVTTEAPKPSDAAANGAASNATTSSGASAAAPAAQTNNTSTPTAASIPVTASNGTTAAPGNTTASG